MGTTCHGSPTEGNLPSHLLWKSADSGPQYALRSSTHNGWMSESLTSWDTGSPVKFGVSAYPTWSVFQPDPGAQTLANSPTGSSGFPMASMRHVSGFAPRVEAASQSCFGMPHA